LNPTDGTWGVIPSLVMNHDAEEEFVGVVFYSVEGEFREDPSNMALKITFDGVEQLDTRARCGNHKNFALRGGFASRIDDDFH